VLVSGFGRFRTHVANASGLMVSELLPALAYPLTEPPSPGEIDPPGPQLAVEQGVVDLPGVGEVDLLAAILPVFWGLAAYLLLREIEAFAPDVVVMNGVAGPRQKLWLELGALNGAKDQPDGSGILVPSEPMSPVLAGASDPSEARSNLASWHAVADAARSTLAEQASIVHAGERLDEVLQGVAFAGYPRKSNSYLCNATTYVVGYALDHPGEPLAVMQSDDDDPLAFAMPAGHSSVPRWFMHWPSDLAGDHVTASAAILRAALAAQLRAVADGPAPSRGDNALAEIPAC
jgi:hypothetical protein